MIVAGEIVALGGPIVRGPGEGEPVVRFGGDGQHFISPFDRPAAHEGSAVPTLRWSGDNDLGERAGCLHVRGGHGVPHGGRVPITVQLGVLVQHAVVEEDKVSALVGVRAGGRIWIHELRAGSEVGGADVQRLVNIADVMDEQAQRRPRGDAGGIVRGGAVALENGDAIPDHVDDVDVQSAGRSGAVMRLLKRDVGEVIGVLIVRPGRGRQMRVSGDERLHLGGRIVGRMLGGVRPRGGMLQGFVADQGMHVRDGVG